VYGTTEMGANPALSWLAVIGYSCASAIPGIIIGFFIGPQIRELYPEKTFSTTDFGLDRYGRVMQLVMAIVSGFYMFIFIVAELTSISAIFATLTNNFDKRYMIGVTLAMAIFTMFYTTVAGLPASIITDKFQGFIMAVLVLVLTFAVTLNPENAITRSEFALASNWTLEGFQAAITLIIAIACAELFNQGTWQRVWAAESMPSLRKGFAAGSVMIFFLMMFFGVMGMIAYAKDPEAYDNGTKYAYLAFFDLLLPLNQGWHIVTLILVTALSASSIDSLQNGICVMFAHDVVQSQWNPKLLSRILLVLINIPAMWIASKQYGVISLFLVADLVCATSVFPVFLGLQRKDYGILKAPTELGAFLGCLSGVAGVLINGIINGSEGGLFAYFWLPNGGLCSLCGTKTLITFIVTPLVGCVMTYVFTYLDLLLRGERARQPLIQFYDKDTPEVVELTEGNDKMTEGNDKMTEGNDKMTEGNNKMKEIDEDVNVPEVTEL
jgi:solute:Na+ symporter, SSS family